MEEPAAGRGMTADDPSSDLYAAPRHVDGPEDCAFYHTVDLPGFGVIRGMWDHRATAREYLGGVAVTGKRVLEVGAASGFFTFWMESEGAEVVGYDLSDRQDWDIVPYEGSDIEAAVAKRRNHIRQLNNSWWLGHRATGSKARMVYGSTYEIPAAIGKVEVATFGNILRHVRDPFLALQRALALTTDTVVVTESGFHGNRLAPRLARRFSVIGRAATRRRLPLYYTRGPSMTFVPDHREQYPYETWWYISPAAIKRFIGVLGFDRAEVSYHFQHREGGGMVPNFTVVGHRTGAAPAG